MYLSRVSDFMENRNGYIYRLERDAWLWVACWWYRMTQAISNQYGEKKKIKTPIEHVWYARNHQLLLNWIPPSLPSSSRIRKPIFGFITKDKHKRLNQCLSLSLPADYRTWKENISTKRIRKDICLLTKITKYNYEMISVSQHTVFISPLFFLSFNAAYRAVMWFIHK